MKTQASADRQTRRLDARNALERQGGARQVKRDVAVRKAVREIAGEQPGRRGSRAPADRGGGNRRSSAFEMRTSP